MVVKNSQDQLLTSQVAWTRGALMKEAHRAVDAISAMGDDTSWSQDYKNKLNSLLDAIIFWNCLLAVQREESIGNTVLLDRFATLMKDKTEELSYSKDSIFNGTYCGYELALGHVQNPEAFGFVPHSPQNF